MDSVKRQLKVPFDASQIDNKKMMHPFIAYGAIIAYDNHSI